MHSIQEDKTEPLLSIDENQDPQDGLVSCAVLTFVHTQQAGSSYGYKNSVSHR